MMKIIMLDEYTLTDAVVLGLQSGCAKYVTRLAVLPFYEC
jgi:hypothetical protein